MGNPVSQAIANNPTQFGGGSVMATRMDNRCHRLFASPGERELRGAFERNWAFLTSGTLGRGFGAIGPVSTRHG